MRTPITLVEFATPPVPDQPKLSGRSWILGGVSSHHDLHGHCVLAPGLTKHESLGTLFADIPQAKSGIYHVELGVVLPDLFPSLNGELEYSLIVNNGTESKEVFISNVMARLRYVREENLLHAMIPRCKIPSVREGKIDFIPSDASVELIRTMAACQFQIQGENAEAAFETHFEACIHDLIERLNKIRKYLPFVDDTAGIVYSVAYSIASLPQVYFVIKGDSDKVAHGWISPHIGRAILNPPDLSVAKTNKLKAFLAGGEQPDEVESILNSVQMYADAGVYEYVLLLSVIAGEIATQRFVRKKLLDSDVSKTSLDKVSKDLTYSMMLNILLNAVAPSGGKPDKNLISRLNRARVLRNNYMHEGKLAADSAEILELFNSTKEFVAYLKSLDSAAAASQSPPTLTTSALPVPDSSETPIDHSVTAQN